MHLATLFKKKQTSLLMCIVGVNSLLKSQKKTFIWDHRDLSITETEFTKRANVLDKTLYLGNFQMACIRPSHLHFVYDSHPSTPDEIW